MAAETCLGAAVSVVAAFVNQLLTTDGSGEEPTMAVHSQSPFSHRSVVTMDATSQSRERFKTHRRQGTADERATPKGRRRGGQDTTRPHKIARVATPSKQGETTEHTAQDNKQGQRAPPKESLHHVQCCQPTHPPSPARARPRAASITHRTHSHALQ